MAGCTSSAVAHESVLKRWPLIGEMATWSPRWAARSTPQRAAVSSAIAMRSAWVGRVVTGLSLNPSGSSDVYFVESVVATIAARASMRAHALRRPRSTNRPVYRFIRPKVRLVGCVEHGLRLLTSSSPGLLMRRGFLGPAVIMGRSVDQDLPPRVRAHWLWVRNCYTCD